MLGFLKHIFGRTNKEPVAAQIQAAEPEADSLLMRNEIGVTVDADRIVPEERGLLDAELARQNQTPLFEGHVKHGYSKSSVGNTDICPRCHSPTRLHSARFIYSTDKGTRVMLAPAGFFCTRCPTVIVDVSILVAGMKPGLDFHTVLGIDYGGKKPPDPFSTWNGRRTLFLLNEEEREIELALFDEPSHGNVAGARRPASFKKRKHKRQLAKQARKRNRKHR